MLEKADLFSNRNLQLDLLRTIAIFGALTIHSSTRYASESTERLIGGWFALLATPNIALFLFISGFLFDRAKVCKSYLFRKYKRVLIPYLFFSLLSVFYQKGLQFFNYILHQPFDFFARMVLGETWGVYYFVFVIVMVYTIAYIALSTDYFSKNIRIITLVFLALNILHGILFQPLIHNFGLGGNKYISLYEYRSPFIWTVYFFFGILFKENNMQVFIDNKKNLFRIIWLLVLVLYSGLHFANIDFFGYDSVIGTVFSFATIAFLLSFKTQSKYIIFFSEISYFLYLSHIFFVYGLQDFGTSLGLVWPFYFSLVSFLVSLLGPLFLYLLSKVFLRERSRILIGA
jgi:surface polysaccharide O-acyltransferase-like enzyme